jgi:hypothetical protein
MTGIEGGFHSGVTGVVKWFGPVTLFFAMSRVIALAPGAGFWLK